MHQHINDFTSNHSFSRDIYQPVASFVNSNTFQGSMRAFGGLAEAGIGGAFAMSSIGTGVGPLAGFALMAHGFDNYRAGMNQVFNNASSDPMTVRALQQTGLSHSQAHLVNDGISLFGSLGAGAGISMHNQGSFKLLEIETRISKTDFYRGFLKNQNLVYNNPLENTFYSPKVLRQMKPNLSSGRPDFHGFPSIVDNYAKFGTKTTIRGADGITRTKVNLHGGYGGKNGYFEWIVEPNNEINHRIFIKK